MTIGRNEPWSLLNQLQRELERSFEGRQGSDSAATAEWTPAVDIKEEADRYVLLADLPGVSTDNIDVSMEQGVLTLRGERNTEARTERSGYKRIERVYGSFYRRFSLPDTADADGISARYNNGVLEIVIPKKAAIQPRRIVVSAD
ncbi:MULTISPECIES: Hsp20/alpha crystallin family protein [Methylococcus]|jgi:HSP20 family protein|uniref:Heat shock protein, Hsp20 family n=2 Tax=Methylococcus capsulatus TaxID=414 RepID=Q604K7_METCA|nr:Hsp20/alpha crystallin family protein [Methylococcus capsulatus]AAU91420.1 heat shock protein, Hsp20 family [Methylococcus capsulatus str. Bath]QXP86901.1 Hsp20/alpha crystallin family protein [Methylococcus capsulatus]QXP91752.1 Hsp20/alpha crystallin family protein [Methylococcus capsulatus]QXP93419.1 Hsp20/alpha crystallin family protein [Methylococcus capsulatus]UQN11882.1 Hsp20/alpha crystallin family protein [Methylococcus capsulatus]